MARSQICHVFDDKNDGGLGLESAASQLRRVVAMRRFYRMGLGLLGEEEPVYDDEDALQLLATFFPVR